MSRSRLIFLYFDGCEILDFAGPLQVFYEANILGAGYELLHCSMSQSVRTAQGILLAGLERLPVATPQDRLFIPGYTLSKVKPRRELVTWIQQRFERGW